MVKLPFRGKTTRDDSSQDGEIRIPENALEVQNHYIECNSIMGRFRIYGRGKYDYAVSANELPSIVTSLVYQELYMTPRPETEAEKRELAEDFSLRWMWDYYVAAAAKAGVAKEDVGRQLEAEHGVPWTYISTPSIGCTAPGIEAKRARFKELGSNQGFDEV
ncbi:hypothetical protein F4776DRAFT_646435 [Hypoxylon sp. NC0597]|nr:hypothetical protein F4776DRAFT_646435 [Hypoxylon sp. NC0597]